MEKKEILASQIEIQSPIEILDPRVTRYAIGKRFSKLIWEPEFMSWVAVSRTTGKRALIGANNIKGVILLVDPVPSQPKLEPAPITSELAVQAAPAEQAEAHQEQAAEAPEATRAGKIRGSRR